MRALICVCCVCLGRFAASFNQRRNLAVTETLNADLFAQRSKLSLRFHDLVFVKTKSSNTLLTGLDFESYEKFDTGWYKLADWMLCSFFNESQKKASLKMSEAFSGEFTTKGFVLCDENHTCLFERQLWDDFFENVCDFCSSFSTNRWQASFDWLLPHITSNKSVFCSWFTVIVLERFVFSIMFSLSQNQFCKTLLISIGWAFLVILTGQTKFVLSGNSKFEMSFHGLQRECPPRGVWCFRTHLKLSGIGRGYESFAAKLNFVQFRKRDSWLRPLRRVHVADLIRKA